VKRVPLLEGLATKLSRHFPSPRATETTTILASARNPVDDAEFVTTFVGPAAIADKRARAVFYYQYDGRIVFEGSTPKERSQVATYSHASRTLLPDLKAAAAVDVTRSIVDTMAGLNGRLAGSSDDLQARRLVFQEFTMAGLPVSEQAFSFEVKSPDLPPHMALQVEGYGVDGSVPLVASPGESRAARRVEVEPGADLAGNALLVDVAATQDDVLTMLRSAAELAKARGAVALIVRLPESPSKAVRDLILYPGDVVATMSKSGETKSIPTPAYVAAGVAARTGSVRELALPAVAVPHDFDAHGKSVWINTHFKTQTITSANVVARVKALGKQRRPGVVVLGAHFDHLGAGFPGADDDASGVAALCEAARVVSAHADLLGRDVVLVAFGAEEWGLRGSKAFVDAWPKDQPIVGMIQADTVGRRGVADVNVVGVSKHPRLAQVVAAALEQSNLDVGKDIDKYAFAWGSDHWSFHEAGIPAVDLWSGDYAVMHTAGDTAEGVDEMKVSRVGRAMALAAFAVAGGF
jgi:hypothetical protein